MGLAIATRAFDLPAPPDNEDQRRVKVAQTGIVGQDLASQFEIFGDVVRLITSADQVMINILDGENMFTIGGWGARRPADGVAAGHVTVPVCADIARTVSGAGHVQG